MSAKSQVVCSQCGKVLLVPLPIPARSACPCGNSLDLIADVSLSGKGSNRSVTPSTTKAKPAIAFPGTPLLLISIALFAIGLAFFAAWNSLANSRPTYDTKPVSGLTAEEAVPYGIEFGRMKHGIVQESIQTASRGGQSNRDATHGDQHLQANRLDWDDIATAPRNHEAQADTRSGTAFAELISYCVPRYISRSLYIWLCQHSSHSLLCSMLEYRLRAIVDKQASHSDTVDDVLSAIRGNGSGADAYSIRSGVLTQQLNASTVVAFTYEDPFAAPATLRSSDSPRAVYELTFNTLADSEGIGTNSSSIRVALDAHAVNLINTMHNKKCAWLFTAPSHSLQYGIVWRYLNVVDLTSRDIVFVTQEGSRRLTSEINTKSAMVLQVHGYAVTDACEQGDLAEAAILLVYGAEQQLLGTQQREAAEKVISRCIDIASHSSTCDQTAQVVDLIVWLSQAYGIALEGDAYAVLQAVVDRLDESKPLCLKRILSTVCGAGVSEQWLIKNSTNDISHNVIQSLSDIRREYRLRETQGGASVLNMHEQAVRVCAAYLGRLECECKVAATERDVMALIDNLRQVDRYVEKHIPGQMVNERRNVASMLYGLAEQWLVRGHAGPAVAFNAYVDNRLEARLAECDTSVFSLLPARLTRLVPPRQFGSGTYVFIPEDESRTLKAFWIKQTEVTRADVSAVAPSLLRWRNSKIANQPWRCERAEEVRTLLVEFEKRSRVNGVSVTFRLPTVEEWVHAATIGMTLDSELIASARTQRERMGVLGSIGWFVHNSGGHIQGVGRCNPNRFGMYDVFGNARELAVKDGNGSQLYTVGGSYLTEAQIGKFTIPIRYDERNAVDVGIRPVVICE